ncbi:transcription factor 24-like [Hippoglossus hippoglossus]|uniref:transcription factor 24-like n=1 Tax=Hippoglossus hippoglossus TaxID=8267 RepID=UPI00148B4B27|nr:transcription factor 24-like [Hippoglossus hippoglossus]
MVGRQTLRMDSGTCSGTVADESPASSPSSSPSPDGGRRELQRARVLQGGCSGGGGLGGLGGRGRPAAANAARERSRVQTLRNAFLELQRTLPSVPPDTKLSKLDVLILATTYIAHLTRTLQEEGAEEGESTKQTEALHSLKGDGYLHPVKKWPMRSRLYVGASGQFLNNTRSSESENQGPSSSTSKK